MAQTDRRERCRVHRQDGIETVGVIGQPLQVTLDPSADVDLHFQVMQRRLLMKQQPGSSSSMNQANHELGASSLGTLARMSGTRSEEQLIKLSRLTRTRSVEQHIKLTATD